MKVYTIGIEFFKEETHVGYRYRTDLSGFGMEDFHCGMPDLEYDSAVPSDFGIKSISSGNETDFVTKLEEE